MKRFVITTLILFAAAIVGYQIYAKMNPSVVYVSAEPFRYEATVPVSGYVFRDETAVKNPNPSNGIGFIVENGRRVNVKTALFYSYDSEADLNNMTYMRKLNEEISLLSDISASTSSSLDKTNIDSEIAAVVAAFRAKLEKGDVADTDAIFKTVDTLLLRKRVVTGENIDISRMIAEKKTELNSVIRSVSARSSTVYAQLGGYFTGTADGLEGLFTPERIENLTVADFAVFDSEYENSRSNQYTVGRIADPFSWYYAFTVDSIDFMGYSVGRSITLRFDGVSADIKGTICSISKETDGKYAVAVRCNTFSADLLALRKASAQIIVKTYNALKIPTEAVRFKDGVKGVYILHGPVIKFRSITAIYEGMDYVAAEMTGYSESLLAYDQVIISSKLVEDGKVVG